MFDRLGIFVSRHWLLVLATWVTLVGVVHLVAPRWDDVTRDGDFAYLPRQMTSVQGEALLRAAFPDIRTKSSVVLILSRAEGELRAPDYAMGERLVKMFAPPPGQPSPIVDIRSYDSPVIGKKLISRVGENGQAMLIVLMLGNEFMAIDNFQLLTEINQRLRDIRAEKGFPEGLDLGISGSAAVGFDMLYSANESIQNTEMSTVVLVVLILVLVYRAPGLVIVPLVTILASVVLAMDLVATLAWMSGFSGHFEWFDFKIFKTTKIFVIVILFGAGTDFCLFLISRYREELQRGLNPGRAVAVALRQVGNALTGSALTTVFGLGMMFFADFGKFSNSGPAIALCLVVTLIACLTLAPAMLRAGGRIVFWPFLSSLTPQAKDAPASSLMDRFWQRVSRIVIARPGLILVGSLLLLAPMVCVGWSVPVTYDLLSEMQADRPSVQGTRLLRRHFVTAEIDPVTLLVYRPDAELFSKEADGKPTRESQQRIAVLTKALFNLEYVDSEGQRIRPITSVRSLSEPLGNRPGSFSPFSSAGLDKLAVLKSPQARAMYVSQAAGYSGKVARFDLVFQYDPFSRESVDLLGDVKRQLETMAADPKSKWHGAEFRFVGTTAGIRDLAAVTTSDQTRIQQLVVIAVLFVLVLILRRPVICIYLILSVLLGYFVTIGTTELFFAWLHGDTYTGLDWKLPLFLFVILVAVGEDYNIYLVTRVFEEQKRLGPTEGLRVAVARTGGIITSCGVIMAGTFASMITGTLRTMHEMGFALAVGVLLDTFVIRTILVPAFLVYPARWAERREKKRQATAAPPAETDVRDSVPAEDMDLSASAPRGGQ